ncbi:MAG: hypothetical protein ACJ8R9_15755 [Steroidobacteraceae bacterium]
MGWVGPANRNKPELVAFDRYGRRLDEVRLRPRARCGRTQLCLRSNQSSRSESCRLRPVPSSCKSSARLPCGRP